MTEKKAQILLRNVVYSSHNNEGDSECVFTVGILAKPLCRSEQYAISGGGIITLTLEY